MRSCLKSSDCPKCQETNLTWTKTSKNKNWLKDERGKWHNCMVMKKEKGKIRLPKCPDCPWNFGHYSSDKQYKWHRKVYHPFNEVWTKEDKDKGDMLIVECRLWATESPVHFPLWEKYRKEKETVLGPQDIYMGKKYKGDI